MSVEIARIRQACAQGVIQAHQQAESDMVESFDSPIIRGYAQLNVMLALVESAEGLTNDVEWLMLEMEA